MTRTRCVRHSIIHIGSRRFTNNNKCILRVICQHHSRPLTRWKNVRCRDNKSGVSAAIIDFPAAHGEVPVPAIFPVFRRVRSEYRTRCRWVLSRKSTTSEGSAVPVNLCTDDNNNYLCKNTSTHRPRRKIVNHLTQTFTPRN
jgi:hypothetical protein